MTLRQDAVSQVPFRAGTPRIVLDTNVVLDWLVFGDPRCSGLSGHIADSRLAWYATTAMRDELAHVLPRPGLAKWQHDVAQVLFTFDEYAQLVNWNDPRGVVPAPVCKDPDDQKFVDLAWAIGACWLLTHDRALLELARPASRMGVRIVRPYDGLLARATAATAS